MRFRYNLCVAVFPLMFVVVETWYTRSLLRPTTYILDLPSHPLPTGCRSPWTGRGRPQKRGSRSPISQARRKDETAAFRRRRQRILFRQKQRQILRRLRPHSRQVRVNCTGVCEFLVRIGISCVHWCERFLFLTFYSN